MKLVKCAVAAALLACVSVSAFAANWVSIGGDDTRTVAIDSTSFIRYDNNVVDFWAKIAYRNQQRLDDGTKFNYEVNRWHVDCTTRRMAAEHTAQYTTAGKRVASWDTPSMTELEFQGYAPETFGDTIITAVCK